ncbi:MAG: hypothetical protein K1060chlam5_00443 [Candidatus Anoxychlamydiales bacterium]|nr:hypothetical protein [Candidatus Anoxychlamydiales bacterium]
MLKLKNINIKNFVHGLIMGLCDLLPGISGSTIAFMMGIYDELISSLNQINFNFFKTLFSKNFQKAFEKINIKFLSALLLGMIFSIIFFSKIINYLLNNNLTNIALFGFFLGALISSIFIILKNLDRFNLKNLFFIIIAFLISYFITLISNLNFGLNFNIKLILCGFFAMCAMLLPGISGSFILLVLGVYKDIIFSLSHIFLFSSIKTIFFVSLGVGIASLIFPKIIFYFLKKYKDQMTSLIIGFLIASSTNLIPFEKKAFSNLNTIIIFQLLLFLIFLILGFLIFFIIKQKSIKKFKI